MSLRRQESPGDGELARDVDGQLGPDRGRREAAELERNNIMGWSSFLRQKGLPFPFPNAETLYLQQWSLP